jgi:hypothetical protein
MTPVAQPGDHLIPEAPFQTSWSIEIEQPPAKVWPWLVQMGYERAGWYIDAWWDKTINEHFWPKVVAEEHRADHFRTLDHLVPELQDLAVGDIVPDGPPGSAWFTVEVLEPDRALVLLSDRHIELMTPVRMQDSAIATHGLFSWAFLLDSLGEGSCRLTIRTRATMEPRLVGALIAPLIKVIDRAFVNQMLRGIKRRVEEEHPATPAT